jgi:UDP-N-acetylmuramoyl-L-alanyl-D-glutamate--2,6-diaminopimelate ligase
MIPCGVVGTLGSGLYGALGDASLTTPDALTLQSILRHIADQSIDTVVMEVSSHGLDQGRIHGIPFELGVFTNLSQDHLDYHGDMANYAAVKRQFFSDYFMRHAIINIDDSYGRKWASELSHRQSVFTFSTQSPLSVEALPLIYAEPIQLTRTGIQAYVHTPWGKGELMSPIMGQFNMSNLLAALTALCLYGISFDQVLASFTDLKSVPGRMQRLGGGDKPLVVVDYAHKPDALEKVLQALRVHIKGKLICVFGCGGNRDTLKRPIMGAIAERLADRVIVTNDNPRDEKPEDIVKDILRGFSHPERVIILLDRSKAIENSIQLASSANDCILIAGKGAEHYQQIGDKKILFDDVNTAMCHLSQWSF